MAIIGGEDSEDSDEEIEMSPGCSLALVCINLVFLIAGCVTDTVLVSLDQYYAGDIVMISFLAVYELIVLEVVLISLWYRRESLNRRGARLAEVHFLKNIFSEWGKLSLWKF